MLKEKNSAGGGKFSFFNFLKEKETIKFIPAARLNVEKLTEQALWKKEIWI